MSKRIGYILTLDPNSDRAVCSKNVLENIGFDVIFIKAIPNDDKIMSNKISMQYIYSLIIDSQNDYSYVFEDDINVIEEIRLDEIIQYEKISEMFFYLGLCEYKNSNVKNTGIQIKNHDVYSKTGFCAGLHAIGLSKTGAEALLKFSHNFKELCMDVILSKFSETHPAMVVRHDLESYIEGHRGILYQDRRRFPSGIW
jgi:hypothetical protein